MDNLKTLNFPFKFINFFAYQNFLLPEIFKKTKIFKFSRVSIFKNLEFLIKLTAVISISYYCNFAVLSSSPDISSAQNILHYVMKFIIAGGRVVVTAIYVTEGFLRTKNLKKVFKFSIKIQKNLSKHFLHKINFENVKQNLIRDSIFGAIMCVTLEAIYFYLNSSKPYITLIFIVRCLRTFISTFEVIRFRFYINFINIHLKAILRILNENFLEFSKNDRECSRRINSIRTCYILLLNMMKNFATAAWLTTTLSIFLQIVTCVRRLYRWYSIVQGVLQTRVIYCKHLILKLRF